MTQLQFTYLNYIINYTLHYNLLECTFNNSNYKLCYTLHSTVDWAC